MFDMPTSACADIIYFLAMIFRTFILLLLPCTAFAQLWDQNIVLGYKGADPLITGNGGTLMTFSDTGKVLSQFNIKFIFNGRAYISNAAGDLLMYSNGCEVMHAEHTQMVNGGQLGIGTPFYNSWCLPGFGMPSWSQIMFPAPGVSDRYIYLHNALLDSEDRCIGLYATVDASAANGLGAVIDKNTKYLQDTIFSMTDACRHGNGRDWWVINGTFDGKGFTKHLFTPSGVVQIGKQNVGPVWKSPVYAGSSDMSSDGTRYVRQNPKNGTDLFYFDRCTGVMIFDKHINFPTDTTYYSGICFSPSGKYIYVTTAYNVWQMDITVPVPITTLTKVAEYDGYVEPFGTYFLFPERAPDGKIYIPTSNGTLRLHTIHQPNAPGLACDLRQHDVLLPTYNGRPLMNTPNYRLFDLQGSPCDTLGIDGYVDTYEPTTTEELEVFVYPNPAICGDACYVQTNQQITEVSLVASDGRVILDTPAFGSQFGFTLPELLPTGVYFVHIKLESGVGVVKKLVVVR
jgi:hypothetical protein